MLLAETTSQALLTCLSPSYFQLDAALKALTQDLRYASTTIQNSLDRFQRQKVIDLKEMIVCFATFHQEWIDKVSLFQRAMLTQKYSTLT